MTQQASNTTVLLAKIFAFAVGLALSLWFIYTVTSTILFVLLSIVSAMLLNAPVSRLEEKHWPRPLAVLMVFISILLVLALMVWLVVPIVNEQLKNLSQNIPVYINNIEKTLAGWKASYFHWAGQTPDQGHETGTSLPSFSNTLQKLGGFSISLVEGLVLSLLLISLTIYMV